MPKAAVRDAWMQGVPLSASMTLFVQPKGSSRTAGPSPMGGLAEPPPLPEVPSPARQGVRVLSDDLEQGLGVVGFGRLGRTLGKQGGDSHQAEEQSEGNLSGLHDDVLGNGVWKCEH